ncbi:MAG: hypothetical protein ACTHQQ_23060 [Solirubrobacteraceae bacterium]
MRTVAITAAIASTFAAIAIAGVAGASTQPTKLLAQEPRLFQTRPGLIWMGVDGGVVFGGPRRPGQRFGHVTWRRWGTANANGIAIEWVNNCNPDCAQGTYKNRGATKIHAWRAVRHHFTRMTLRGPRISHTFALKHSPRYGGCLVLAVTHNLDRGELPGGLTRSQLEAKCGG